MTKCDLTQKCKICLTLKRSVNRINHTNRIREKPCDHINRYETAFDIKIQSQDGMVSQL